MKKLFLILSLYILLGVTKSCLSKDITIVAKVNNEIITNIDLYHRLNLALILSKLPNDEEIKKKLSEQLLNVLVEEKLKIQEANRLGIFVTSEEVLAEINVLEKRLNFNQNSLIKDYEKKNIPKITIFEQIRSQILWRKVIYNTVAKNIAIPEVQIKEAFETYVRTSGGMEYNFSEIFISFSGVNEEDARNKIQSIASKANAENFSILAEQFSDGAVIYEGNNTNWTRESILSKEVKNTLATLEIGEVSKPVKGATGYHIYLINKKRKTKKIDKNQTLYDLSQIFFKLDKENRDEKINYYKNLINIMREVIYGCDDLDKAISEVSEGVGGKMGVVNKDSIEKEFLKVIEGLKVGKLSDVTISKNGIHSLMLCSPVIENTLDKLKQNIEGKIRYTKINNSAELYLNRLKKKALIEINNF